MKKKIANALELILLAGSFVILNIECILGNEVYYGGLVSNVETLRTPLALMSYYKLQYYPMLFLYAVLAIMCVVSIVAKSGHRDGKLHSSLPILWFLITNWNLICLQGEMGSFSITGYEFPTTIFEILAIGVVVIGFAKRSTLIAGLPKTAEVVIEKHDSSQADELKKYKELLDAGAITQDEYDAKKKQLLSL